MNIIHVFEVDNYMALFVNNQLVMEDHKIEIEHLKKHCPIEVILYDWVECNALMEYVFDNGSFPEDYNECLRLLEKDE